jgi:hypothetical protein
VHSGEEIKDESDRPLDFTCTPWLAESAEESAVLNELKTNHHVHLRPGQIFLDCAVRRNGEKVQPAALIVNDGALGTIEMGEQGGQRQFRIEVRPSTSAADIAGAKKAMGG